MSRPLPSPWDAHLHVRVGPYDCAVRAASVVAVTATPDVPPVDLAALFGLAPRQRFPVTLTLESTGERFAIGVDGVRQQVLGLAQIRPMPTFGLRAPGLFSGAFATDDRLLLQLDVEQLAALVRAAPGANVATR